MKDNLNQFMAHVVHHKAYRIFILWSMATSCMSSVSGQRAIAQKVVETKAIASDHVSPNIADNQAMNNQAMSSAMRDVLNKMLVGLSPEADNDPVVTTNTVHTVCPECSAKHYLPDQKQSAREQSARVVVSPADDKKFKMRSAAFGGPDRFFVGPEMDEKAALSRAFIGDIEEKGEGDKITTKRGVIVTPLASVDAEAPFPVTLNGAAEAESPLSMKPIAHIALAGKDKKAAVVIAGDPSAEDSAGANVYVLTTDDGKTLFTNEKDTIKDADGKPINQQIVALAATRPDELKNALLFAAVADGGLVGDATGNKDVKKVLAKEVVKQFITAAMQATAGAILNVDANKAAQKVADSEAVRILMQKLVDEAAYQSHKYVKADMATFAVADDKPVSSNRTDIANKASIVIQKNATLADDIKVGIKAAGVQGVIALEDGKTVDDAVTAVNANAANTKTLAAIAAINAGIGWAIHEMMKDDAELLAQATDVKKWASLAGDDFSFVDNLDGVNRGFAVLKQDAPPTKLVVVGHDVPAANLQAQKLDLTAESDGTARVTAAGADDPMKKIAFFAPADPNSITRAMIGPDVDMHWDEPLQRLYIGLSDVTRGYHTGAVNNKSGGVCSVLVGKVDGDQKLSVFPVIKNVSSGLFQDKLNPGAPDAQGDNFNKYILGFYQKDTENAADRKLVASARKVRTMHTSTGKSYLVVNGGAGTEKDKLKMQLYALPLVGGGPADDKTGFIADKTKHVELVNGSFIGGVMTDVKAAINYVVNNHVGGNDARNAATGLLNNAHDSNFLNVFVGEILKGVYAKKSENLAAVAKRIGDVAIIADGAIGKQASDAANATVASIRARLMFNYNDAERIKNAAALAAAKGLGGGFTKTVAEVVSPIINVHNQNFASEGAAASIEGAIGFSLGRNFDEIRKQIFSLTVNDLDFAKIGADPQLLSSNTSLAVSDIQVHGDTVYVAVAGERDDVHNNEAGIFASTALFDENGLVRAWTPWQRVMGSVDVVAPAFGFDADAGNFWYATTVDGKAKDTDAKAQMPTTVKVTQWGVGDKDLHSAGEGDAAVQLPLSASIETIFGDIGGLYGLFNFDAGTQGFKEQLPGAADLQKTQRHQQFSMMVATGLGRVALIETGRFNAGNGVFKPTSAFAHSTDGSDAPIYVFDVASDGGVGIALGRLGAITSAEVSRLPLSNDGMPIKNKRGWLFVGGENGVAVLANGFDGSGWGTGDNGGLDALQPGTNINNFPGGSRWSFMQLMIDETDPVALAANPNLPLTITNPFKNVRKLVSDGNRFLYVVTVNAVFRVDMTALAAGASIFKRSESDPTEVRITAASNAIVHIASTEKSTSDGMNATILDPLLDSFFDAMVVKRSVGGMDADKKTALLLATSRGLFANNQDTLTDEKIADFKTVKWAQVKTAVNNEAFGPVLLLEFASSQRGNKMKADAKKTVFTADGNVQALAFSKDQTFLARYRFDVLDGIVKPLAESYKIGANPTGYFYKLGSVVGGADAVKEAEFLGPLDFYLQTKHVANSRTGFVDRVPMLPDPALFLNAGKDNSAIDLGLSIKFPLYLSKNVRDTASGAVYIPGEFGVRVNE